MNATVVSNLSWFIVSMAIDVAFVSAVINVGFTMYREVEHYALTLQQQAVATKMLWWKFL